MVDDDSYGFWRRVRIIPFNRIFKGADADPRLAEKLKSEAQGILSWLVKGCLLWQKEGLDPTPNEILIATLNYQAENDVLAEFFIDCCIKDSKMKIRASVIFKAYKAWADQHALTGKDTLSNTEFGSRMTDQFEKRRSNDGWYYFGVTLKANNQSLNDFRTSDLIEDYSIAN